MLDITEEILGLVPPLGGGGNGNETDKNFILASALCCSGFICYRSIKDCHPENMAIHFDLSGRGLMLTQIFVFLFFLL